MLKGRSLTLKEKYSVRAIDPKYAPVKGNREPESRCCTERLSDRWMLVDDIAIPYAIGPIMTAQEARNSTDPIVHLRTSIVSAGQNGRRKNR